MHDILCKKYTATIALLSLPPLSFQLSQARVTLITSVHPLLQPMLLQGNVVLIPMMDSTMKLMASASYA